MENINGYESGGDTSSSCPLHTYIPTYVYTASETKSVGYIAYHADAIIELCKLWTAVLLFRRKVRGWNIISILKAILLDTNVQIC